MVKLKCKKGHEIEKSINEHIKGGTFGCKICFFETYPNIRKKYFSWGESVCAYVLNKIGFKFQYKLEDKIFDFYVNGKIIEFDGSHHFNKKYLSVIDKLDTIDNDIYKTNLCLNNKIPLLRISYKEILEIEYWIDRFLKSDCLILYSNDNLYQSFPRL